MIRNREKLCEDLLEPQRNGADRVSIRRHRSSGRRFAKVDINLLRAVLFLLPQRRAYPTEGVLNWLRCEDLSDYDRKAAGRIDATLARKCH